jgi:hypothetical protein
VKLCRQPALGAEQARNRQRGKRLPANLSFGSSGGFVGPLQGLGEAELVVDEYQASPGRPDTTWRLTWVVRVDGVRWDLHVDAATGAAFGVATNAVD